MSQKNIIVSPHIQLFMEKRILELLTSHGTLVSPETMAYILSKPDPETYANSILKHFSEIPLFLTVDQLKAAEEKIDYHDSNNDNNNIESIESSTVIEEDEIKSAPQLEIHDQPEKITPILPSTEKTTDAQDSNPDNIETPAPPEPEQLNVKVNKATKRPIASEYDSTFRVIKDVTGNSTTEGTISDFTKYFQERYRLLKKILMQQRREVIGASEIARIRTHTGPLKFIGIINTVRTTKQGHKLLELEDESDYISVLINNSSPLISLTFVPDEVICVIGKMGKGDLVYVEDIIRPDIPITRKQNRSVLPLNCLFISDIHIGSSTFLHKGWDRFINWLNGGIDISGVTNGRERIKYIVVSGDTVDGIGIYPNQESELEISDIYRQYEALAEKFQDIPDHIQMIIQPGNHDAVRPAEPQPTFPSEITQLFSNDIEFVGNPCYFAIENVEILSYHGRSMDDFVMQIPEASYNKPIYIMKEMLMRRHLAPIYGSKTPIAPEHQDYLLIDKIPDIFVTGHIHKTAIETYRDISLINASAWQSQTSYQKMMNFNPEPGRAVLADLQFNKIQVLDFS